MLGQRKFYLLSLTTCCRSNVLPYYQEFGMLNSKQFKMMKTVSGKFSVPDFNGFLRRVCNGRTEKYVCLPQPGAGLRFRLVSTNHFEFLLTKAPNHLFKANGIRVLVNGAKESGPFCSSPHPVVSTWLINQKGLHLVEIEYRFTELLNKVYGNGFGDRDCTAQMGANIYLGTRASGQSTPSPVEGPGRAVMSQYYREYYKLPCLRPFMEKTSNSFLERVQLFSTQVDYLFSRFLPMMKPCALWTQGVLKEVYGFSNDRHLDRYDQLSKEEQENKMEEARSICASVSPASQYTQPVLTYLEQCSRMIGLGYATTCGYQHVYHPKAPKDRISVHQFFVMPGLGCTCPIQHQTGHHFAAYAFSHYTSGCVVVQDGLVHWRNDGCVNVVAWGAWQSSKKKKKNQRKRKGGSELVRDRSTTSGGLKPSVVIDVESDEGTSGGLKPSVVMDVESVEGIARTTMTATASATTPSHENLNAADSLALRNQTLQRYPDLAAQYQLIVLGGVDDESTFWSVHQDRLELEHARTFNTLP